MRVTPLIALCTTALLLAGCGEETVADPTGAHTDPVAGDEPITARAVAAVALEHVPTNTSSRTAASEDGVVGAEFRYGTDGEYDGDMLVVGVAKARMARMVCRGMEGCERQDVEGGELVVAWQEVTPEADPGVVTVAMVRDDEVVVAFYQGTTIEGDPRDQDLSVPVGDMEAVVRDQRISLTTSAEVIELGERLEGFQD